MLRKQTVREQIPSLKQSGPAHNRVYVLLLLSIVVFLAGLVVVCQFLPYCLFNLTDFSNLATLVQNSLDEANRVKKDVNALESNAAMFLQNFESRFSHPDLEFLVIVITTKRKEELAYLTRTSMALLEQAKDDSQISIVLMNMNRPWQEHREALELARFFPLVNGSWNPQGFGKHFHRSLDFEFNDYIEALEYGSKSLARFVMIVQDDVVINPRFFKDLRKVIYGRLRRQKWVYLRLFYPLKWLGYGKNNQDEHLLHCVYGGLLGLASVLVVFKHKSKWIQIGVVLCCIVVFVLVPLVIGRQHVLSFSPYRLTQADECCIPISVYPKALIPELVSFLRSDEQTSSPIDLAIAEYTKLHSDLTAFGVLPNMAKHIGFWSSLNKFTSDPREFSI
jgi:hypothetical protein